MSDKTFSSDGKLNLIKSIFINLINLKNFNTIIIDAKFDHFFSNFKIIKI